MSAKVKKRVRAGLASQEVVSYYVKAHAEELGFKYRVASKAGYGQQSTDLSFVIDGSRYNFEVKGAAGRESRITVFDKSVRRRNVPTEIQRVSLAFVRTLRVNGERVDKLLERGNYEPGFLGLIDFFRDHVDPTVGLAEDENSTSSGKLPRDLFTRDPSVCLETRQVILDVLRTSGDNYFAVHDKSTDDVDAWHTGLGTDLLKFGRFPTVKSVALDTYGGQSKGATRIGLKVTFQS